MMTCIDEILDNLEAQISHTIEELEELRVLMEEEDTEDYHFRILNALNECTSLVM